jgi:hypothetical protein
MLEIRATVIGEDSFKERAWPFIGSITAGLGGLTFAIIASRSLGLEGFAPVAQVWTVWSLAAATVTFSMQQVAAYSAKMGGLSLSLGGGLLVLAAASGVFVVTWLYRLELFYTPAPWWPLACALLPAGSFITGVARGRVAAFGTGRALAFVVGGENLVRVAFGLVLFGVGASAAWFAGAIFSGFGVAVLGLAYSPQPTVRSPLPDADRTMWSASIGGLAAHSLLVLAPPGLALSGASAAAVSGVFLLLAVYRAPYQLLLGIAPDLAGRFGGDLASQRQVAGGVSGPIVVTLTIATALLIGLVAAPVGEILLTPLLGVADLLTSWDHALAASLTVLVSASVVITMILTARRRNGLVVASWLLAAAPALVWLYLRGASSTTVAFLILNAAALAGLCILGWGLRPADRQFSGRAF